MAKQAAVKKTTKKVAKKVVKQTPKKVTKKVTAKKVVSKNPKSKAKKVKMLVCAPDEKCFWTTDGKVLSNLDELRLAFGTMDEEVFLHHVSKEKNDFADWVEHVLDDVACAAALRKARKLSTAETTVVKCLRLYNAG